MVITDAAQITPTWLDDVLIRNNALSAGHVSSVSVEGESSANSSVSRLHLTYTPDAQGKLPTTLFLKLCSGVNFGVSEVEYYTRDYVGLPDSPLPRCYDAHYTDAGRAYHILMEDLQATHHRDCPPTLEMGLAAADAFAALHAHWWGADRLQQGGVTPPTRSAIDTYIAHIQPGLQPLLAALKTEDAIWKPILIDAFAHHPALMIECLHTANDLTLIHGDPNPGNIMWAKSNVGKLYLIDRQPFDWSLTVWLGVSDLAYMMVTWWDAEVRRPWQEAVLRRYHDQLCARGVNTYSWDQLWYDYRLTAVQALYIPPQWCTDPRVLEEARWLWEMQLGRAMRALVDLECDKLWKE